MPDAKQQLNRWIEELALWQALELPEDRPGSEDQSEPELTDPQPPAAGQIRLWPGGEVPLYGCLIEEGYAEWTLLPFSPLRLPAVPQELQIRESGPAAVLQGWNRRKVSTAVAAKSWCVEQLSDGILLEILQWLLAVKAGEAMPPRVINRIGPPLRHPLDPRQEYLMAEDERWSYCFGDRVAESDTEADAYLKAAEKPEEEYGE
jgi:hypothetical protein